MEKKQKLRFLVIWLLITVALLVGSFLVPSAESSEGITEAMRDAVLHEENRISLFGLKDVNPGLISAFVVTAVLLIAAAICRIFIIPRFKLIPGKAQLALETLVNLFDGLAKGNSPHCSGFISAYIFGAGTYIFVSTCFELFGIQAVTTTGAPISLPAPLSDVNGAIAVGVTSYLVIMGGGIAKNGLRGLGQTLKDFSLPLSMSLRLFGALLSGLLVTELVYRYAALSYVLPVVVAVLFTLMHALIQAYVLSMLASIFFGEVTEVSPKKAKKQKAGT